MGFARELTAEELRDLQSWRPTLAAIPLPCDTCGQQIPPATEYESTLWPVMRPTGEYTPPRRCASCAAAGRN